jgi:membrane protein YdbS with pleckstrin-like domain
MSRIKRQWTAREADQWTKEDYLVFIISPLVYLLLAVGTALSLFLFWYGWVILAAALILLGLMIWIIDPKLKAISADYETKQKKYLEEIEKIERWEE